MEDSMSRYDTAIVDEANRFYQEYGEYPVGKPATILLGCERCKCVHMYILKYENSGEHFDKDVGEWVRKWTYALVCPRCGFLQIEHGMTTLLWTIKDFKKGKAGGKEEVA